MKNHGVWKAGNRERRAQMVVEMEAKKYGKAPDSESTANPTLPTPTNPPPPQVEADQSVPQSEPATGDIDFDYSQTMSASKFNVQVRIGPNGETVVDEESLYVDNSAEQDTHDYTHVEESDTTKFVNSATHSKKLRGSRWSTIETELFYDVGFSILRFGWSTETLTRLFRNSARIMS
jgi:transcription factor TFIIIB component B''